MNKIIDKIKNMSKRERIYYTVLTVIAIAQGLYEQYYYYGDGVLTTGVQVVHAIIALIIIVCGCIFI